MREAVRHYNVVLALAGLVAAASGCTTLTTLHTAHPVQRDTKEVTVATGVLITPNRDVLEEIVPFEDIIPDAAKIRALDSLLVVPTVVELQFREGIGDRLDVGAKLHTVGLTVDANWMLWEVGQLAMSIDPALSGFAWYAQAERASGTEGEKHEDERSAFVSGGAWVTVLFDIVHNRLATVTVGPRAGLVFLGYTVVNQDGTTERAGGGKWVLGAMSGARFRLGDRISLLIELSAHVPGRDKWMSNATIGVAYSD